jgi:importin subunit alpha-6/7
MMSVYPLFMADLNHAHRGFRKLLSVEANAPVQECINIGAIPLFVNCLQRHDFSELQFEAAWALTNVASTDRTAVVVESGSIPYLCQLLMVQAPEIREQAAWCLGNVAGDRAEYRDLILNQGALMNVVANIMNPANVSLLRNCTWTLSNLCRGKPQPRLATIHGAFPALQYLLLNHIDQEAMIDATWALSYICDGDNDRIQVIVNLGVIPTLIAMLNSNQQALIVPALRTLGNIVSGEDSQTDAVVKEGVLSALGPLLSNAKRNVKKESLWMLSNIAAGTKEQLNLLMCTPLLLAQILEQLSEHIDWDIRKEACWVICNIASSGVAGHIFALVEHGIFRYLSTLLDISDVKMLTIVLEALEIILRIGQANKKDESFIILFDEAEGIDKLEALQEHENEVIYKKAVHIIEAYFNDEGENDGDNENIQPMQNQNQFSFGLNVNTAASTFGDVTKPFSFAPPPAPTAAHFTFA